jgi:hypothetical protein
MFCHKCGSPLPDQSLFCPACGLSTNPARTVQGQPAPVANGSTTRQERRGLSTASQLTIGIGLLLVLLLAAALFYDNQPAPAEESSDRAHEASVPANESTRGSSVEASSQPIPDPPMPADEKEFIRAIQDARTAFQQAPNETAPGGTRAQRREAICRVLSTPTVSGWIGHISKLGSNSDGKGVLEISLADGLSIKTWNNDLSDISDNTLIDPSSPLFHALSQMKVGDEVSFSGLLLLSDLDCVRESSSLLTSPACEATRTNPRSESLTETKYSAREEAGPAPPPFRWTAIER